MKLNIQLYVTTHANCCVSCDNTHNVYIDAENSNAKIKPSLAKNV